VGVDYSMFYLRRKMEERRAGRTNDDALFVAAATSGRAVLISGLTVMVAMAGMLFAGNAVFTSFAVGTILVVAVALLGSVSVLPAVLAKLGDSVEKGRIPLMSRLRNRSGDSRVWGFVLDRVLHHPALSLALGAGVLIALAVPVLGMHTVNPSVGTLPKDLPIMQTYDRLQTAFPGGSEPAEVVVRSDDVASPQVRAGIAALRRRALGTGQFFQPVITSVSPNATAAVVSLPLAGDGTDAESEAALATLREEVVPQTVGRLTGVSAFVTGDTARSKDFNDTMKSHLPIVFGFVLGLAFLLLLVTFRSVVIPLTAILLNLLSVAAAYGLLTVGFQDGKLESVLNFDSPGGVITWLPLFLFVILFGLSMDYHVLLLSRIREGVDRGLSTEEAVSTGVKSTAGVITSAAVVMVAVFSIFGTLGFIQFKMMGVGLAAAVLIDATIVRAVLVPSAMTLLGRWNWYLPRALRRVPELGRQHVPPPARA
jgi:RND superfamily putative drug exporter